MKILYRNQKLHFFPQFPNLVWATIWNFRHFGEFGKDFTFVRVWGPLSRCLNLCHDGIHLCPSRNRGVRLGCNGYVVRFLLEADSTGGSTWSQSRYSTGVSQKSTKCVGYSFGQWKKTGTGAVFRIQSHLDATATSCVFPLGG